MTKNVELAQLADAIDVTETEVTFDRNIIAPNITGASSVTVSDTPPVGPAQGDLWWDSGLGQMFVYYDDGDSSQWVATTPYNDVSLNLKKSENLNDVPDKAVARTNLEVLGTAGGTLTGNLTVNGTLTSDDIGTNDGTALTLRTNNSERLRIDSSGNVGIGTSSPFSGSGKNLEIADPLASRLWLNAVGTRNYYLESSVLDAFLLVDGTAGVARLRIDASGNVLVTGSGGLGYGVGSGGTVTQATSKSTAVTLNKPCGVITTNNAALASGASVVFTLNNSFIGFNDAVLTSHNTTGGTNAAYVTQCIASGNGSASIRVTNISVGSLSEAININFAIIKGATS